MTVVVVLHLTIDWHHSEWLGTVYDYDYNRTDPTHTDNHYDYDRMVLVYRNYSITPLSPHDSLLQQLLVSL